MRTPLTCIVLSALALVGCGDEGADTSALDRGDATTAVQDATSAATTAADDVELSPDARRLLEDGQATAAQVATTARSYAEGSIDDQQAEQRFEGHLARARAITRDAEGLEEGDAARREVVELTTTVERSAEDLLRRAQSGGGGAGDVEDELAELQERVRSVQERYGGRLSDRVREEGEKALEELDALLGS